jgi:molybdate transport system substrate-binding protein
MKVLAAILLMVGSLSAQPGVFPPWSKGANNPALDKGYEFQVPDIDNVSDLHGNPSQALLVLFVGGNQFMVMPGLMRAFEAEHTLQVQADVYEAGLNTVQEMEKAQILGPPVSYATNDLEIMVRRGNPLNIRSLSDLGNDKVRLSMPNPDWEGVARQIAMSMEKAGGAALVDRVMKEKVRDGTTFLTQIHHRQTPIRILNGHSDAGVTWASEVIFQEQIGNPVAGVIIPVAQNANATYGAAMLKNAPHRDAASAWLSFLGSEAAQKAYAAYGFKPLKSK